MNVLIVPLFPRQFDWLSKAYDGPHHLDFHDSSKDESVNRLKAKAARADKVVVLTKFISHSHYDNNVLPRDKIIYADSVNLDRMLQLLETLPPDAEVQHEAPSDKVEVVQPKVHLIKRPPMSTSTTREVDGFVLTTAVPAPGAKTAKAKYPFHAMHVGESFFVEAKGDEKNKVASQIAAAVNYYRKSHPHQVFKTSTKFGDGVRCWRVPDTDKKATKK